jgi:hypothetical protein
MPDEEDAPIIEDISPETELIREVYARFGLAMYYGQTLEFGIINQLIVSSISDGTYNTYEEAEAAVVRLFRETMGSLNRRLIDSGMNLTHLDDDLLRSVHLRNFLAHHYFRERALTFQTPDGRRQMIVELDQAASFLREMGERLDALTMEILKEEGVTSIDTPEARETAGRLLPGRPLPGLSYERTPIVVTKDGYIVGDGNVARVQLATERGEKTYPMFVLDVEWEKATDDERTRLLRLAEKLDMDDQPPA